MPFRAFVVVSFVLIVALGAAFLVAAGWVPWTFGVAVLLLAGVVVGFVYRRRSGPQTPLAIRPERDPAEEKP